MGTTSAVGGLSAENTGLCRPFIILTGLSMNLSGGRLPEAFLLRGMLGLSSIHRLERLKCSSIKLVFSDTTIIVYSK